jgi:pimeloyl-ACP methyl ester carboxylesterase
MTDAVPGPRTIEFVSRGETGRPVLFLPGSYSTAAAWRGVWGHLPGNWRLAATSLLGCGETAETRTRVDTDMAHELAVVVEAVRRLGGGPVHLVGHSFGGTVALAATLEGKVEVASLALFEANPFDLIAGDAALYGGARALAAGFTAAVGGGEADAPARIINWFGGACIFAAMPPRVQDFCRQVAPANALDWETCFSFQPDRDALAVLGIPVLLVRGEDAVPAMVAVTEALRALLPGLHHAIVGGAGHFLTSTHPEECAALLVDHLAAATAAPPTRGASAR